MGPVLQDLPGPREGPRVAVLLARQGVFDAADLELIVPTAIAIARSIGRRRRNFIGESFWARGYYVSTVGKDEEAVRKYIKEQEAADRQWDQLKLGE